MNEDYTKEEGYNADADLGLGCGLPTQFAGIKKGDCLEEIAKAGFEKIEIRKEKTILISDEILEKHLDEKAINEFKTNQAGIFSITVTGVKAKEVCDCGGCC